MKLQISLDAPHAAVAIDAKGETVELRAVLRGDTMTEEHEEHLTDAEEAQLITILQKLVSEPVYWAIERCSAETHYQWGDVVGVALSVVDWERLASTIKNSERLMALGEAQEIISPEPEDEAAP